MTDAWRDPETGLLDDDYFRVTLPTRVAAARRVLRPLTVVVLTVLEQGPDGTRWCPPPLANAVGRGLTDLLREADVPCRLANGGFGLILEQTAEDGAVWTVERFRRSLAEERPDDITLWAGVASYPTHGLDAEDLLDAAQRAFYDAREWGRTRIEVATSEPSESW